MKSHKVINIDDQATLNHLYNNATESYYFLPPKEISAICSVSHDKTLIFDTKGRSYAAANRNTKQIADSLFKKIGLPYTFLSHFNQIFTKKTYKIPYVYGDYLFVPTNCPTKTDNHWIAFHHFEQIHYADGLPIITNKHDFGIVYPLKRRQFQELLKHLAEIHHGQEKSIEDLEFFIASRKSEQFSDSLIHHPKLRSCFMKDQPSKAEYYMSKIWSSLSKTIRQDLHINPEDELLEQSFEHYQKKWEERYQDSFWFAEDMTDIDF